MKVTERLNVLERSAAQHDKQIKAIRNLVQVGMRLMVQIQGEQRAFRKDMRRLEAAQERTDAALRGFLESRRGSNGHSKRKVDLQ